MIKYLVLLIALGIPGAVFAESGPEDKKLQLTEEEKAEFNAAAEKYKDDPAKMRVINQFREQLGIADQPEVAETPPPPPKHITSTEGSMDSANAAYAKGDYSTALQQYKAMAAQGNQEANIYVGMMYEAGMGTEADKATAQAWYQRAAETPTDNYNNSRLVNEQTVESYTGNRISADEAAQADIINQEINDEIARTRGDEPSGTRSIEVSTTQNRSIITGTDPVSGDMQTKSMNKPLPDKKSFTGNITQPTRTTHYKPVKQDLQHSKPTGHTEHQHPDKNVRELELNTIDKS